MKTAVSYADWYGAAVASAPTFSKMVSLYNAVSGRGWRPRHEGFQGREGGWFVWFDAPLRDVGRFYVRAADEN